MDTQEKEINEQDHELEEVESHEAENQRKDSSESNQDISKYEEKITTLKNQLLRSMAEIENLRVRHDKQISETREYAITNFAKDLVPVLDNFTRALMHTPENLSDDMKNVIQGVEMTYKELLSIFNKHGIDTINPQGGDEFNYHIHHAISETATDDFLPGKVMSTMQIGYKIKDRLLRPASVVIAKKQ